MRYFLSCYQIRKLCVGWRLGLKDIRVSLDLGKSYDHVKIADNNLIFPDGQKVSLNYLCNLSNSKSIFMIENNEIYELFFEIKDKRIYKLITNGELDYPNLEISGDKLFNKNIPIKDLVEKINEYAKDFKDILNIGVKLGYYSITLSSKNKNILVLEEDKYIIEIMRYNPYSIEFFEKKIPYILTRIYYIRSIKDKTYDCIIYCPKPFTKSTRYYYSKVLYKEFYRILKNNGLLIIDLEPPKALTTSRLINNTLTKLKNQGFDPEIDKEYLLILAKK